MSVRTQRKHVPHKQFSRHPLFFRNNILTSIALDYEKKPGGRQSFYPQRWFIKALYYIFVCLIFLSIGTFLSPFFFHLHLIFGFLILKKFYFILMGWYDILFYVLLTTVFCMLQQFSFYFNCCLFISNSFVRYTCFYFSIIDSINRHISQTCLMLYKNNGNIESRYSLVFVYTVTL